MYGPDSAWFQYLQETIQRHYVGPDCYWKNPAEREVPGCKRYFGNAWFVPFPPTVVSLTTAEQCLVAVRSLLIWSGTDCLFGFRSYGMTMDPWP